MLVNEVGEGDEDDSRYGIQYWVSSEVDSKETERCYKQRL